MIKILTNLIQRNVIIRVSAYTTLHKWILNMDIRHYNILLRGLTASLFKTSFSKTFNFLCFPSDVATNRTFVLEEDGEGEGEIPLFV